LLVLAFGFSNPVCASASSPFGAHSDLTAVSGSGTGGAVVSPDAALGKGVFEAQVEVNVRGTTPNTDFAVKRAVDPTPDGVCTGTAFATVANLHSSPGGGGAVEFERTGPLSQFDLLIRVVGADGTVLQSGCMTITAK
jgi:hypothetical protein